MILETLAIGLATIEITSHDTTFIGPDKWTYDARIVVPSGKRSSLSVLMIGGGLGNDLEWTVPGTLEWNSRLMQMTIDGTTHRDAPLITHALANRGYTVMHFSTIAREDPKRDRWPYEVTLKSPRELLDLTEAAANMFRTHPATENTRLVLLGHSMGGQRACALAASDPEIDCLVLLAPAQMTRTGPDDTGDNLNMGAAHERLKSLDKNNDGVVRGKEVPESADLDEDGTLRIWEVCASLAREARTGMSPSRNPDRSGIPFGEHALAARSVPALVLYGSLDEAQAHHAPILQDLQSTGVLPWVEVRVLHDLGHQLGPEQDGRFGPISSVALEQIVEWLGKRNNPPQKDEPISPSSCLDQVDAHARALSSLEADRAPG
ncbi:MAG: lysophospholipase [Phycisphaerales bacterium]|nr:lysophospholipase [Phycisphaerales bacterium]